MESTEDLKYSNEATATEYLFFRDLNDINIFVEDEGKEYEYETIFKRMLGSKYKVTKILGVGGKVELKKCFAEFGLVNPDDPNIKNIYIADGDFDRYIYKDQMINSPHFIYLKAYNIENYFIDKSASEKFAKGQLKCSDGEVELKVDYDNWKSKIVNQASKLFFYYCYMKKDYPEEKSVSRSPYLFLDSQNGFEREGAFEEYQNHVLFLNPNAVEKVEKIKESYYQLNDDEFNIICGKFLFESLYCHIRNITKIKFRKDDFRWHLICNFNINTLGYVKERILSIMN